MSESTNWVQRRAIKERVLDTGAIEVWNEVRSSLEDACESYNKHYCPNPNRQEVKYRPENGNRLLITRTVQGDHLTNFREVVTQVIVEFDSAIPAIRFTRDERPRELRISSNDSSAYVKEGESQISPDEVSRRILEPIFFPSGERTHPIFQVGV
jgi:hypothetical protein